MNSACLLLFVYNLGYKSRIFPCLGKLSYNVWIRFQYFILPTFSVVKYLWAFHEREVFHWHPFLWDIFDLSWTFFSFMLIRLPSLSSSDHMSGSVHISMVSYFFFFFFLAISSLTSFIFDQNFTSSIVIFLFSNWFLIANSFFQSSISVKGYMALSLGDKQTMQLALLFHPYGNWVTDVQWPITHPLRKKWHNWSLIIMCLCYLHSDFCIEELAAKFMLYAITYS